MDIFDNFVLLSDFRLQKNSGNCLPKKPCRIYVLRLSFCTLIYCISLVRIASLFTHLVLSALVLNA